MGHLMIYCDGCGSSWPIYHRDDWKGEKARTCPVCGKAIDGQTWEKQILRAFGEMEDSNIELLKDHQQQHGTLFTVSYIPDVIFPNRENAEEVDKMREGIDDLKDGIDNLRGIVEKLINGLFQY